MKMTNRFILAATLLLTNSIAFGSSPEECIHKADEARAEMLRYKDGQSDEAAVRQSAKNAAICIDEVDAKGKKQYKDEAVAAWKAFCKLREEKILPTVIRYNKVTKDNKANLDKTKDALRALGENSKAADCIKKADEARAALLLFKDGKGDEAIVNQTAKDTSACIDQIDAKGKNQFKDEAIAAWKTFRSVREGKIIPDVKYFKEQSNLNTTNLNKTKEALKAIL